MGLLNAIKTKIPFAIATIVSWAGFLTERITVLYWVKVNFGGHIGIASDDKP